MTKSNSPTLFIEQTADGKHGVYKYSRDMVIFSLENILDMLEQRQHMTIERCLVDLRIPKKQYHTWKKRFKNDEEVMDLISLVKDACAAGVLEDALKGTIGAYFAKFYLASCHGFSEKELSDGLEPGDVTDEEAEDLTPRPLQLQVTRLPKSVAKDQPEEEEETGDEYELMDDAEIVD